jgi:hypothetical protein
MRFGTMAGVIYPRRLAPLLLIVWHSAVSANELPKRVAFTMRRQEQCDIHGNVNVADGLREGVQRHSAFEGRVDFNIGNNIPQGEACTWQKGKFDAN